ncbi:MULTISPECIES: hypothetical protein [unclassified Shewanella]|uniref:hypothetical protein n=1 Tax=unclassified Shewanella TaxID=196818 RepID=UPI000C844A23|nr:hypothetical protein [Shewanella sp. 10N.286.48.B5]PMH84588.1 hypothetical protein BCU57_17475 [Shewanella sp. 10N.286.48.B5]
MKKILLCACILAMTACKTTDIRNIADSVSDIAGAAQGNSTSVPTNQAYSHPTQQYAKTSQTFRITKPTKMNPEIGQIRPLRTEKNPQGMTKVRFEAYHLDSGAPMQSNQYLYQVSAEGWLSEEPFVNFNSKLVTINSGNYYIKAQADTGKFYASGMVTLERGVTNIVSFDLQ